MLSALIIASIAISVAIGYKTKYNTGLFAIVFAYLIGCCPLGMKTKAVIDLAGQHHVCDLSVSLFYNFALVNGTLEKQPAICCTSAADFPACSPSPSIWRRRASRPWGAGFFTVMAFMAPSHF